MARSTSQWSRYELLGHRFGIAHCLSMLSRLAATILIRSWTSKIALNLPRPLLEPRTGGGSICFIRGHNASQLGTGVTLRANTMSRSRTPPIHGHEQPLRDFHTFSRISAGRFPFTSSHTATCRRVSKARGSNMRVHRLQRMTQGASEAHEVRGARSLQVGNGPVATVAMRSCEASYNRQAVRHGGRWFEEKRQIR